MEFLKMNTVVKEIILATHLPYGKGNPVHKNRASFGIAYYVNARAVFKFEGGKVLEVGDGECIFLPKGSNYTVSGHNDNPSAEVSVYAINFLLSEDIPLEPFVIKVKSPAEIKSLFSRSVNCWRKKETAFTEECMSYLYSIISHLKKDKFVYSNKKGTLEILKPALDYIKDNYTSEGISLPHLASLCGVSEVYLRRLFKRAFSESPTVYIRNMRMRYARELIISGEYTVTDASYLAGFNDVSYFSREYRKAFGTQPSKTKASWLCSRKNKK